MASNQKKMSNKQLSRKYFAIVTFLGFMLLGYIAIGNDLEPVYIGSRAIDSLAFSLSLQKPIYVVIIDAGSTGSRVLAFAFHTSIINGNLVLDSELFHEEKPGLSYFADNPSKGMKSMKILIDKAKFVIPQNEWSRTPVYLKATAGLRLLPEQKANAILEECRKFLFNSGLIVSNRSVSIMEGADEGIYSWFTVNFLVDRFNSYDTSKTVAALDLGGGSTQITFIPDKENLKDLKKYLYNISAFNHNMSLYTHSYLGMGLMAARKGILIEGTDFKSDKLHSDNNNILEIHSECINPIINVTWTYGGREYRVQGPTDGAVKIFKNQNFAGGDEKRPIVRFNKCSEIVQRYVDTITVKPLGLNKHEIFAFSYYFDRATEIGLIDPFKGGKITVSAFHKAAVETCDYANTDQPFMCLDLTYIYYLLRNAFNLKPTTELHLYKKINSHELSWALGLAFNVLQTGV